MSRIHGSYKIAVLRFLILKRCRNTDSSRRVRQSVPLKHRCRSASYVALAMSKLNLIKNLPASRLTLMNNRAMEHKRNEREIERRSRACLKGEPARRLIKKYIHES